MVAAETDLVPLDRRAAPAARPPPARDVGSPPSVGGLSLVGATTSMAVAAQSALPGDALYPVKRAIENAQTGLSVNERGRAVTCWPTRAADSTRSASSAARAPEDERRDASTLNTFTEQADEASDLLLSDFASTGDEGSIAELRDFTADSMDTLTELEAARPGRGARRAAARGPHPPPDRRRGAAGLPVLRWQRHHPDPGHPDLVGHRPDRGRRRRRDDL